MEEIVLKTEPQANGEILLFYVDEGVNEEGVVTPVQNYQQVVQADGLELTDNNTYVFNLRDPPDDNENDLKETQEEDEASGREKWTDKDIQRLLVFYIDNKQTFLNGPTKRKHLWTVACKTMLQNKNAVLCEMKLRSLRKKYVRIRIEQKANASDNWSFYDLCNQAFYDDKIVNQMIFDATTTRIETPVVIVPENSNPDNGILVVKNVNSRYSVADKTKVMKMLDLYIKHKANFKNNYHQKGLWESIGLEMGENDSEYWHKRFLNFKNHYIRLLDKRDEDGPESVDWPYMSHFDRIYKNDAEFQRKFGKRDTNPDRTEVNFVYNVTNPDPNQSWDETEMMVLVKYYFDCFHEFQDPSIPKNFLWIELGRLLDKKPEVCKTKLEELKTEHLQKYVEGIYDLRSRVPLSILNDNIISREVQNELSKTESRTRKVDSWNTEDIDKLVQLIYDNIEMFKDSVCHFVCWAAITMKLKYGIAICRAQWQDLVLLYKSILDDKKENPDMQIDWRYIELFDRIFDYGMDTDLLDGYQIMDNKIISNSDKLAVKRVRVNSEDEKCTTEISDDDDYDEKRYSKRTKRHAGDSKAFKILEFYQKHKEKFTSNHRKQALWEKLSESIGISATQCAHRFRNLKQVYTGYVQREISKPEMPILWPYYALCKKVFGYRALKSKLKSESKDSDDAEDWSPKEIKLLINYLGEHFDLVNSDTQSNKWKGLTDDIGRTELACNEKFLELRKSYRKLKTMKERNPNVKLTWKYFNKLDDVYNKRLENGHVEGAGVMEVDEVTVEYEENVQRNDNGLSELPLPEDDDYQCIIVLPEDEEISDLSNAQIIANEGTEVTDVSSKPLSKHWTRRSKKKLLILYLKYLRAHKGKEINSKQMWKEIASKLLNKTAVGSRKMFLKLKALHLVNENKETNEFNDIFKKILAIKPKFAKIKNNTEDVKVYKDVSLPAAKVVEALQYYLQHIEEFLSPKFEKKYLWTELAKHVDQPFMKMYHKIHYLMNNYDIQTDEVAGEVSQFSEILREISVKESLLKNLNNYNEEKPAEKNDSVAEYKWTDDETEQLLLWYLANLEKFKNPKFVRSYLWGEAVNILNKSAICCSKKMSEIRTQYRTMVREKPEELSNWKFYDLCQKIYGTGKKIVPNTTN